MSGFLSIKEYARKHKISIFQAVKLAKSGKVETKTEIVNGKEQIFIKNSADFPFQNNTKKAPTLQSLQEEIEILKKEIQEIKNLLINKH